MATKHIPDETPFDETAHEEELQAAAESVLSSFCRPTDLDMHGTNPWGLYGLGSPALGMNQES